MATFRERGGRHQAIVRHRNYSGSKTFDRLTDAKAWARKKEREADMAASDLAPMTGTLQAVIERYEVEMYPVKRWAISKSYELELLKRELGAWRLADFTKAKLLKWSRDMDVSPSTVASRLGYLHEVLQTARDLWELPVPVQIVHEASLAAHRLKIAGNANARTRRPTAEEIAAIIGWARSQPRMIVDLATVVEILSVMPLRRNELLDIEWDDLVPDRRAAILRSRKHPDVLVHEGNHQEVGFITFGGIDTWGLLSGRPRYFPRPFPYAGGNVSDQFKAATIDLRIEDLHLHDLRAHAISNLLEAEIGIPQVAHLSGHKDWKILQRHYARLKASKVHAAIDAQVARASRETTTP